MTNPFDDENAEFIVLINNEKQYSLWPASIQIPNGWVPTGPSGKRNICLGWIDENWKDMRPASLVRRMDGSHNNNE